HVGGPQILLRAVRPRKIGRGTKSATLHRCPGSEHRDCEVSKTPQPSRGRSCQRRNFQIVDTVLLAFIRWPPDGTVAHPRRFRPRRSCPVLLHKTDIWTVI